MPMILTALKNRNNRPLIAPQMPQRQAGQLIVASYNTHKGVGTDGKRDADRIVDVICEIAPDIIALQEVDTRFGERKGLLNLLRLEVECGLTPVPLSNLTAAHGWHGNIVLVHLPGLEPRGAILADIDLAQGKSLRIIAAHLGLLGRSRLQQARRLIAIMQDHAVRPTVLMGDFNEWRLGSKSALNAFRDAFGHLPKPVASFPSRLPFLALDRIIADREGLIGDVVVHDSALARVASDHLPIKTALALPAAVAA